MAPKKNDWWSISYAKYPYDSSELREGNPLP